MEMIRRISQLFIWRKNNNWSRMQQKCRSIILTNETFVDVLQFLSRKELCRLQLICYHFNEFICTHFIKFPQQQFFAFHLNWHRNRNAYLLYIFQSGNESGKEYVLDGNYLDCLLSISSIPKYIKFRYTRLKFNKYSQYASDDFAKIGKVLNYYCEMFEHTKLSLFCTMNAFPTVGHLIVFMRTNLEKIIESSGSISLISAHLPRFCICGTNNMIKDALTINVIVPISILGLKTRYYDTCGHNGLLKPMEAVDRARCDCCNLLKFLANKDKLYFSLYDCNISNYAEQFRIYHQHLSGNVVDSYINDVEEEIHDGNGNTLSTSINVENLIQWLHRTPTNGQANLRQLKIFNRSFGGLNSQWIRIHQFVEMLKKDFYESNSPKQNYLIKILHGRPYYPDAEPLENLLLTNVLTNERFRLERYEPRNPNYHKIAIRISRELLE